MKTRPWPILILALLHIVAPFGNFILNAHLAQLTLWQKWQMTVAEPNLKINLVAFFAPVVAGLAIYACKKWSLWLYFAMIALITLLNLMIYRAHSTTLNLTLFTAFTLIDLLLVSYFLIPAVRSLYFDPRLRWWEASPRYRANRPGRWRSGDQGGDGELVNFSAGGLFFKSDRLPADNALVDISFGDGERERNFSGHVIHHSKQNLTGFGVKFDRSSQQAKEAADFVRKLDAQGALIRDRLPGPEDSLAAWLKRVFTTGQGLVPDTKKKK